MAGHDQTACIAQAEALPNDLERHLSTPHASALEPRIESIDVLRGVIMIIMALDHTREVFGIPGQDPTNLDTTTIPLFFTRWVTYFCAPVFFLLTGTGAFLAGRRRSRSNLSRFLVTRGLWLVFLELVLARCLVYQFNFDYRMTMLIVLWALGWAMITLGVLVHLPMAIITVFGMAMILGHNLFDSVTWASPLWSILHSPGFVINTPKHVVFVAYPLIPWIGVTAVGYSLGQVYNWSSERRRSVLLGLGVLLSLAFLLIRGINAYGDRAHWTVQKTPVFTLLSFLNTTKYPPSLQFLLMTLGPAMLFLWAVDIRTPRWLTPALVIGSVPLFYYLLHFPLIRLLAIVTCYARYGSAHWMFESPNIDSYPFTAPPEWGYSLPVVYLAWMVVVIAMYPLCRWFSGVKKRRRDGWLSYI
jgi:uncharacterized membrane protein